MIFSHIHRIQISEQNSVHLLAYEDFEIETYADKLNQLEQIRLKEISHITKKREFIATRLLKEKIFPNCIIQHNEVGAPFLDGNRKVPFISISHTHKMVGLAQANYAIGMDLEPIDNKALKIKSKFLSEKEFKILDCSSEVEMTKAWSAKEALYKLAGRREIIFKSDLKIARVIDTNHWVGLIINPNEIIEVNLRFYQSGNNILTINDNECKIQRRHL